jgi:hypothetical protein
MSNQDQSSNIHPRVAMDLPPFLIWGFVVAGLLLLSAIASVLRAIWEKCRGSRTKLQGSADNQNARGRQNRHRDGDLEAGIQITALPPAYYPASNRDLEDVMGLVTPPPAYIEEETWLSTPPPTYCATAPSVTTG